MREVILEKCSEKKKKFLWFSLTSFVTLAFRCLELLIKWDLWAMPRNAGKLVEEVSYVFTITQSHNRFLTVECVSLWIIEHRVYRTYKPSPEVPWSGVWLKTWTESGHGSVANDNAALLRDYLNDWFLLYVISCYRLKKMFKGNSIINLTVGYIFCGSVQLGLKI